MTTEIQKIESKLSWIVTPAHLILSGLLVVALLGAVYLFESKRADVADSQKAAAEQVAAIAEKAAADSAVQNASIQAQNQQVQATLSAANAQLQATVGQLKAANGQLANALAAQQKVDATLSPTSQAQRWQMLVPGSTVVSTTAGFSIDAAGGLATLQSLEEVTTDRERITNFTAELKADDDTITNTVQALQSEKAAHTADILNDQKQLTAALDENKKTLADFKAYKAHARKGYLKAFGLGFITGFFVGHSVTF